MVPLSSLAEENYNSRSEGGVLPGSTRVFILGPFVDVIYVVHSELCRLNSLPARRQALALQRMAPVGCIRVMIYIVFPSSNSPVHRPARRKR